ncbi:putative phage protein (predicted DNA packaging) [Kineothrix alysoides]|uniref:Putative phage protein (Predicted DNA packaging) n=1 Tax=Kineothrix alysoides TaxID=1469948 RepID=A0A4R1R4Y1_9FIRM|nr:head-tail connector protein [Kineothrix alysoides]TCL60571.1 putative phage protein (predicted DNA packaging) [Kineothrix alysoides]
MIVTIETAKCYLRVDSSDEDEIIHKIILSAESIVMDVMRIEKEDLSAQCPEVLIAVLYAMSYLYEHREVADHKELISTLRSLLFGVRREVF